MTGSVVEGRKEEILQEEGSEKILVVVGDGMLDDRVVRLTKRVE